MRKSLGGPLEDLTLQRLWLLTRGSPLFLREVVEGARETNQLVETAGVWRWQGAFTPTPRLGELIASRLDQLTAEERRLVGLLAFGEPLGAGLAAGLVSARALRGAERRGVVAVEGDGRRRPLRLSHPLYAEVVRAEASALEASDLRGTLVRAQVGRLRRRGDILRQVTLQLDAEGTGQHELLTAAARQAIVARDLPLAERLAGAALAGGGGFAAQIALAAALNGQGEVEEAESVLSQAAAAASTDQEHAEVALNWAPTLFCGQGRAEDAERVLTRAYDNISEVALGHSLIALRSAFSLFTGRPKATIALAAPVLASPAAADEARVWASASLTYALARCGRTSDALDAINEGWKA